MRMANKHEYKNYLANQRIAVIQKASRKTHLAIQFINNRLIDKLITEWNDEYSQDIYDPFDEKVIFAEVLPYNTRASSNDIRRILQHSLVARNVETEAEAVKVIRTVGEDLTRLETERIVKNLDFVENALRNADLDIRKYESIVEKLPSQTSRKSVLEKCITTGTELEPTKRQQFLERALERGSNYKGREYSYRELDQLSRDLERYKANRLDYETAIMENKQADREGYDTINETKTWIWSHLDKTRHSGMDGETVPLTSPFEVVNEVTGDVDYLLFPGDVSNDHNNCSNICNCQCSYEINQQ